MSDALPRKGATKLIADVRKALALEDDAQARAVIAAAEPLWEQLASFGTVDSPGGAEWERVLPDMLRFVQVQANLGPEVWG